MLGGATRPPVVAGVDESEAALAAVRWAAEEATRRGCALQLFHAGLFEAVDLTTRQRSPEVPLLLERAHRWMQRAAHVGEETAPGVRTDYLVRLGPAADLLIEHSAEASLVVVGSHSIGGLRGVAIGSVALRVAAGAHCPVVVVRGRVNPDGPVVAGVDEDAYALQFAFETALSRCVPVIAAHAWHEGLLDEQEIVEAESQSEEEELRRLVGTLARKYPEVQVRSRLVRDRSAARALMGFDDAQLIVIGTRGRGPVSGGLFGSTGNRLLAQAACPVAVVH
ncbi:universal stress protein [Amycolatopsis sp. NPDC049253]|uniref:universal stress protein n=1 Tax=Amycolatopsis sp. NPDC049253 TaxID=3155274 RepID=UPI0034155103